MSELKRFGVENILGWTGQCKEECSSFALQRERTGVVPIIPMVGPRNGRSFLSSFSTEAAALEKLGSKKMATESWSSLLVGKERKQEAVFKLCNHQWRQDSLK